MKLAPGSVVGGVYRIDAEIGAGGFGAVFRATRLDQGREVALKVLLSEHVATPELQARFAREARLAQQLGHPNTVRVLDFGTDPGGVSYIAFELLRGRPLGELVAEGPMAPERVAHVAAQILKSLMEAHGLGIVHRDIKPANVLVCPVAGDPDHVRVVDFGIAKASSSRGGTALTAVGQTLGTPAYMAPEQVLGRDVGPATDLYALGLVMAELLSGETVFKGDSGMAICMAQVADTPAPLPSAVLASPLAAIVTKATRKRVEERYASAEQMLADLAAISSMRSAVGSSPVVVTQSSGVDAHAATSLAPSTPGPMAASIDAHAATSLAPSTPGPAAVASPGQSSRTAPTLPARSNLSPKPKGLRWIVVALLVIGVIGVGLTLGLRPKGFLRNEPKRPLRRSPTAEPGPDRPLARMTPDTLKNRIVALGWSVGMDRPVEEGAAHVRHFLVKKAGAAEAVTVLLYEHPTPPLAHSAEQALTERFPKKLIAREGTRVLVVSSDPMSDATSALFEDLQR